MTAQPLLLEPLLKERVWGGRGLERLNKKLPDGALVGESWELADLPDSVADGRSVIASGPWAGRTLRAVIAAHTEAVMGTAALSDDGGFPLLIKYLDARANLSVQVHPPPAYARRHPGAHVKSEAWVIVDAEPDAVLYKGLRPGITGVDLVDAIREDRVVDCLARVPARVGDCHYLPSGTCHALGAGILVAEVQTPSDTTFRIYDWGRTGRELHVDEAISCMESSELEPQAPPAGGPILQGDVRTTPLLTTPHFTIDRTEAQHTASLPVTADEAPVIWMVLAGEGRMTWTGGTLGLRAGTTVLVPAAFAGGGARLETDCVVLRVAPPRGDRDSGAGED